MRCSRGTKYPKIVERRLVEEILSPFVVGTAHQAHDVAAGVQIERARLAHQLHASFSRILIALVAIAGMAAGNKIFPG